MWPTWNGIDGEAIGAGARCRRFWKVYLCISGGEFPSICLILLVLIQLPSAVEVAACRESDKSGNIITISAAKFEDGTVCAWGGYNGQTICAPLATSHSSVDQVFAPDAMCRTLEVSCSVGLDVDAVLEAQCQPVFKTWCTIL